MASSGQAQFSLKTALSQAWSLTKKHFWLVAGVAAFNGVIIALVAAMGNMFHNVAINDIVNLTIDPFILVGSLFLFLRLLNNQSTVFSDYFKAGRFYLRAVGLLVILAVIVLLGFVLLIIPGIYLAIRYSQAFYVLVDQDVSIGEALQRSARLTKGNAWALLGCNIVFLLIVLLGALLLGIGLLWAVPVIYLAQGGIYLQLKQSFGSSGKAGATQPAATN